MESQQQRSQDAALNISTSEFDALAVMRTAINQYGAQQQPEELIVLLSYLAATVKPRLIVELGYGSGGLSWALQQLPSRPTVLSVTLPPGDGAIWTSFPDLQQHVMYGDTTDHDTVNRVYTWLGGANADLLIIDADHTYQAASSDWRNYAAMVKPGGLIAFHDIALASDYPDIQVHRLWAELRGQFRTLEIVADPTGLAGYGLLWPDTDLTVAPGPLAAAARDAWLASHPDFARTLTHPLLPPG